MKGREGQKSPRTHFCRHLQLKAKSAAFFIMICLKTLKFICVKVHRAYLLMPNYYNILQEKVKSLSHVSLLVTPLTSLPGFPCPWDFSDKNTGVGCHFLLQGKYYKKGQTILHTVKSSETFSLRTIVKDFLSAGRWVQMEHWSNSLL